MQGFPENFKITVSDSQAWKQFGNSVALPVLNYIVNEILKELPERDQMILKMRFGLIDGTPKTLQEVGDVYNVTRERVRQLEQNALRKLNRSYAHKEDFQQWKK